MIQVLLLNYGFKAQGLLDAARIAMIRTDIITKILYLSANNCICVAATIRERENTTDRQTDRRKDERTDRRAGERAGRRASGIMLGWSFLADISKIGKKQELSP
ncbi:hypothetical protein DPMN_123589 [Dreissena polymorpha]|uniref:Uncharacterized protein n=1 Tax=Dreissena polymorpha TaxID=45954 RepID=A0A9D4GQM6_DREPO|nr:hypothetical protein DPMN_123589 [Dreissena polymorpha]